MSKVVQLTDADFEEKTSTGIVLIDFWAPWCGPCKMFGPILEEIADEIGSKVLIAKVNVDEFPAIAQKFGVRSIPAIFLLKNGEHTSQFVGVQDKKTIINAISKAQ